MHRYVGLTLALLLIVNAATGSRIAFYSELGRTVDSKPCVVEPRKLVGTLFVGT